MRRTCLNRRFLTVPERFFYSGLLSLALFHSAFGGQASWVDGFEGGSGIETLENVSLTAQGSLNLDKTGAPSLNGYVYPVYPASDNVNIFLTASIPSPMSGKEYSVEMPQERGSIELWIKGTQAEYSAPKKGIINASPVISGIYVGTNDLAGQPFNTRVVFAGVTGSNPAFFREFNLVPDKWSHLVITWDMVQRKAAVYLDGIVVGGIESLDGIAQKWRPGNAFTLADGFTGTLSSVRILATMYTAKEAVADFEFGRARNFDDDTSILFETAAIVNGTDYSSSFLFPEVKGMIEIWVFGGNLKNGYIVGSYDKNRNQIFLRAIAEKREVQVAFQYADTQQGSGYVFVKNFRLIDNRWNHVAIAWDTASEIPFGAVFLNGKLLYQKPFTRPVWTPSQQGFKVGENFTGQLSQLRVLSIVPGRKEIAESYFSSIPFDASGAAYSKAIRPIGISEWDGFQSTRQSHPSDTLKIQVEYLHKGNWAMVPDADLPGNQAGFDTSINLHTLGAQRYPEIRVKAIFGTRNSLRSPLMDQWALSWNHSLPSSDRLFLTKSKITDLRTKLGMLPYSKFWREMEKRAIKYAQEIPWDPSNADDLVRMLDPGKSREAGNRLPDLAMAYRLTGEQKYLDGAVRWMDAILTFPAWGGNNDLGAAHILFGMSLAYDWLYDDLTGAQKAAYEQRMATQAWILHNLLVNRGNWWAQAYLDNHNYVNTTAIMAVGIVLYGRMNNAIDLIDAVGSNFDAVLTHLPPDGTSAEGVAYWSYGIEAMLRYFAMEESVRGVNRALESPWFRKTSSYRLHLGVPGFQEVANIADGPRYDYYGPANILQRLGSLFREPADQWLAQIVQSEKAIGRYSWENMLWYDETLGMASPQELNMPTHAFFEDLGIFSSRSSWEDPEARLLVMKAAPPLGHKAANSNFEKAAGHVHPDEGAFLFYGYGKALIVDDGYSYLKRTLNHNIATFDDIGQLGEGGAWFGIQDFSGNKETAAIVHTAFNLDLEYLVADLSGIYRPEADVKSYRRHLIFVRKEAVVVIDEIELNAAHTITWNLHLAPDLKGHFNGRLLTAQTEQNPPLGLAVQDLSADEYQRSIEPYLADSASQAGPNRTQDSKFNSNRLRIQHTGTKAVIITLIRSFKGASPAPVRITFDDGYRIEMNEQILLIDPSRLFTDFLKK